MFYLTSKKKAYRQIGFLCCGVYLQKKSWFTNKINVYLSKIIDMNKEFVTYEQAVSLKELGFDEPCLGYWRNEDVPNPITIGKYTTKEDMEYEISGQDEYHNFKNIIALAPLYQQAFRWFREKHNIRVWTEWGSEYLCCAMIQYSSGMKECIDCCSNDEEAEQACLDKLIEIIKNK